MLMPSTRRLATLVETPVWCNEAPAYAVPVLALSVAPQNRAAEPAVVDRSSSETSRAARYWRPGRPRLSHPARGARHPVSRTVPCLKCIGR